MKQMVSHRVVRRSHTKLWPLRRATGATGSCGSMLLCCRMQRAIVAALLAFEVLLASPARADDSVAAPPLIVQAKWILRFDGEEEYYVPTKSDRPIQSGFVNVAGGLEWLRGHLAFLGGVTSTGADGYILQYNAQLQNVRYDTAALGVGPMFKVSWAPLTVGRVSLALSVVGSLIVYDTHFPVGGDIYDFSWRLGGEVAVRIVPTIALVAGSRWMHVSNGQGLGPQNPSYEGAGFFLGVTLRP